VPYARGFKDRMIQRMAAPRPSAPDRWPSEVGVAQATLSRWLQERRSLDAMGTTNSKRDGTARTPGRWTAVEKLRVVRVT
jgi:hypothetical protein